MKRLFKHVLSKIHGYFHICDRCGYAGSDWPDSGECPSCGEVN